MGVSGRSLRLLGGSGTYFESHESTWRATVAMGGELDENILAYTMAVNDHLKPTEARHVAQIVIFPLDFILFASQATFLAEFGVFDAEPFVAAPRVDELGFGRPSARDAEHVGCVVAVELVMEFFAYGVKGD